MLDNWKVAVGASLAVASGAAAATLISGLKSGKNDSFAKPTKWIKVGEVSNLILYPVKSCKGVHVKEAIATEVGLRAGRTSKLRDRVFMVVDSRYVFQTQRTIPKMALIETDVNENFLILNAPGMETIAVQFPEEGKAPKKSCRIFDDHVAESLDCGDEVGKWLDSFLEKSGFRLVYHSLEKTQREMTPLQKKFPTFVPKDKGAFQDQTSYMLISEDSLAQLNNNLETTTVTHRNFRPSILIQNTPEPFAEDFWGFVKIGKEGPVFKAAKPCTRCKLTTVNPDTGEFIPSGEPLSKLTKMTRTMGDSRVDNLVKNQGIIGLQLGLFEGAATPLKVGDSVYAACL